MWLETMHRTMLKEGYDLSEFCVRKIMRENGFYPVVVKKYRPTSKGKSDGRFFEDRCF
jgi:hypothetical protein